MRCTTCDYPLWNLPARQCPECGAAFLPSAFDFEPSATRFCCPHCDHPYLGTSDRGQLEPAEFDCLRCGRRVHVDDMIVRPGLGLDDAKTRRYRMPWLERREIGRFKAWFVMIGHAMARPRELARSIPVEAGVPGAWAYALLTWTLVLIAGTAIPTVLYGGFGGFGPFGISSMTLTPFASAMYAAVWLLGYAVVCAGVLWVWVVVVNVVLLITGGAVGGIRRTAHAIFFSAGASVLYAFPCFGFVLGWVWWAVSATVMLRELHGIRVWRAALAVFLLPGLLALGAGGLWSWQVWRATQAFPAKPQSPATTATHNINYALLMRQSMSPGATGPDHVIELFSGGNAFMTPTAGWTTPTGREFLDPSTQTSLDDVPVADMTLQEFGAAPRGRQLRAISDVLDAMPAGVVAYRFGDFVFTYSGASTNTWDPDRWIVVMLPDPAVNLAPAPDDPVYVGTADYQVTTFAFKDLQRFTTDQNTHRAKLGLSPLPDLLTVTHDQPVVGPAPEAGEEEDGS